jgi:hypothetical protein
VAAGAGGSELRHRPAHLGPPADSDHENYDRVRDELAVADIYEVDFEPPYRHGPITDTTLGDTPEHPADARATAPSLSRGLAGTPDFKL